MQGGRPSFPDAATERERKWLLCLIKRMNRKSSVRPPRGCDDDCDLQVEPVVAENNGIVDRLHRMVTDIAVLEELLSVSDPVGKLRAFSDSLDGDERLVKLKSLALAQRDELLNDISPVDQLHAFRVFLDADERLANLKCLAAEQRQGLDIFDVLQIHHLEYVHSNFLAWLLDPRQSHGTSRFTFSGTSCHVR